MVPVGFIGAGNMAQAIITGVINRGLYKPEDILIYEVNPERAEYITRTLRVRSTDSHRELLEQVPIVVLAVKPGTVKAVLGEIRDYAAGRLIISIAAGVTLAGLQEGLGGGSRVIRVMPNTPALVQEGASALAAAPSCTREDVEKAQAIFAALGLCLEVPEELMDAVTGLSGSGPAFCFLMLEALSDGGVRAGLPRAMAIKLAAATMKGAAHMVLETGRHPGELKDMVTSPAGTTIEGLQVLESAGVRSALMEAVWAACRRAGELAR